MSITKTTELLLLLLLLLLQLLLLLDVDISEMGNRDGTTAPNYNETMLTELCAEVLSPL